MFWLRLKLRKCWLWNSGFFAARVLATETMEGEFMAPAVCISLLCRWRGKLWRRGKRPEDWDRPVWRRGGSRVCALPFGKLSPWNGGREGFSGNLYCESRAFLFEREDTGGGFASCRRPPKLFWVVYRAFFVNDLKGEAQDS